MLVAEIFFYLRSVFLPFAHETGYGAFSYSKSDVPRVINYIQNQKEHHKQETFAEEYLRFLEEFKIEFDERYILKSVQ